MGLIEHDRRMCDQGFPGTDIQNIAHGVRIPVTLVLPLPPFISPNLGADIFLKSIMGK